MTMTQSSDFKLPYNSLTNYIPTNLRNTVATSLFDNLFNRFLTHDESIPLYGYVGRKPASPDDRSPRVPQSSVERDINSIIPVLNFNTGTEKHTFTVEDIIKKAEAIGISSDNLQWLYSQGNNYLPPINLDKFTNFFNYYWVAKALPTPPSLLWNEELLPEYYVIAPPTPSDLDKLNVVAATTSPVILTGSGFNALSFELNFLSPTTFNIDVIGSLGTFTPVDNNPRELSSNSDHFIYLVVNGDNVVQLLEFDITRDEQYDENNNPIGLTSFSAGDKFVISPEFLTRNYSVSFSGSPGIKGKVVKVKALNDYQEIDGVKLKNGDRVLVKSNSVTDDGIYIVSPGKWQRSSDFNANTASAGAKIFVKYGDVNGNKMFTSIQGSGGYGFTLDLEPEGGYQSNTNEWQEGNYWIAGDKLVESGLSRADVIQAVRPIIEYNGNIQLNKFVKDGLPSDNGTSYRQIKSEFNQLPLFDLFRYNGSHANLVSSVFFYEEDLTAALDLKLQKRVLKSNNDSADFVFNHGMVDEDGRLLFVKSNGKLKTIWHAGFKEATIVDSNFYGLGNGKLVNLIAKGFTQQQVWTLTAESPTTFNVVGSKIKDLGIKDTATVGVEYDNGEVSFTINQGQIPFEIGDTFAFRVGNLESPRYVSRNEDDEIFDLYGGPENDIKKEGAWQIPRTFYNNPYNESASPVAEGVLYSHFRGILTNQLEGSPINYSFGGSIKLWSEQQTLLASLLMQRDMTPISMIDLSQRQYETALNIVRDIFQQNIAQFIGEHGPVTSFDNLKDLMAFVQEIRSHDNDVKTVLYDSTAAVTGFPATLPQLGILPLVKPSIEFDEVLGRMVIIHHDGHKSVPFTNDDALKQSILGNLSSLKIKRSDGLLTPAISYTEPTRPYKGEMFQKVDGTILSFNVSYDTNIAPSAPKIGETWYRRSSNELFEWDGDSWNLGKQKSERWEIVNFADTLNSLILLVENKLYDGINPNIRKYDFNELFKDKSFIDQLKKELFSFAAINGFDPFASDYDPADAFTWNYSSLNKNDIAQLPSGPVPARWHVLLTAHQSTINGVIPTERPNLEPWKLLNFETKEEWISTLTTEQIQKYFYNVNPNSIDSSYTNGGSVTVVSTQKNNQLIGLPVIDNVQLKSGDLVLIQNDVSSMNNGIWAVNSAGWTRTANSTNSRMVVNVIDGSYKGTNWVTTDNQNGIIIKQIRLWSTELWKDIKEARPLLKISVDEYHDTLLPPFVSSVHTFVNNAITKVRPSSASQPYMFGQSSPVETIWTRSLDYGYALARALFRYDPLAFLGFGWGFNWVECDGILYDGADMNMPGHKRFKLHGDAVSPIYRKPMSVNGLGSAIVTYDGYNVETKIENGEAVTLRLQNFTIRRNGEVLGYVNAGDEANVGGLTFTIDDEGIPFRIGDRFEIANGSSIFVPTARHFYLGFGQTFTNALRETSIDTTSSYSISAFREWDVNMGFRAGGLVATDDLQVYTDNETLSSSAYDLIFKKNQIAQNEWIQALRISVIQFGKKIKLQNNAFRPEGTGEDWTFRIEGYNPRYTDLKYYDMLLDNNAITFNALNKESTSLEWYQPTNIKNVISSNLPLTIVGVQNVVSFLFGYAKYLESRGWEFNKHSANNIDQETGRTRNFQLEIEKFVDRCYRGIELDQGHVVNPFIDNICFNQKTGLLSEFIDTSLFDVTGHPGVFDALGVKFKKEDLDVIRTNEQSSFGAVAPMFSAHIQLDEYEHIFIFNNFAQQSTKSGLLYDAFSGAKVATYKFNGRKQATQTMRPEFGGHYLVGHEVHQNLQASTDSIQNLYDANKAFENEVTTRHALALLGFNRKQYFDDLDISEKTQFNFWRGLIQSKGTNLSIDAYLNNNRFDDAKIDEYWAYKLAEYGDARQRTYPELKLSVNSALTQFTQIQFDAASNKQLPGFEQINHFDESKWFSIDDMNQDVKFMAEEVGRYIIDAVENSTYDIPFVADKLVDSKNSNSFDLINATTIKSKITGKIEVVGYGPAAPNFNPVKIFNYIDNELVAEIPLWHPAAGKHTPTAMENINIISDLNPAKYNYSTQAVNNNTYDPLRPWGINEVGRVWFDTRNLSYLPYYDKNIFSIDESLSRWGTLADFASIDVYEWVQSSVPPSEYDALSAEQAGDAELNNQTKAAGQVADKQLYFRDRVWKMKPIAWSFSPVPSNVDWEATPPFPAGSTEANLSLKNGYAILDKGTFEEYGIAPGMHLGAWNNDKVNPKPLSEYLIEDSFSKNISFTEGGSFTAVNAAVAPFKVDLKITNKSDISGQLLFSNVPPLVVENIDNTSVDVTTYVKVTEVDSGKTEIAIVNYTNGNNLNEYLGGATLSATAGQIFSVNVESFGFIIEVTCLETGVYAPDVIAKSIVDALNADVFFKDAVVITPIVPGNHVNLSNDLQDNNTEVPGWRVWSIPSQTQLDNDSRSPFSSWKPYYGDYVEVIGDLIKIQDAAAYLENPLTLNSGETVDRYKTSWTDWQVLENSLLTYPKSKESKVVYQASKVGTTVTFSNLTAFDSKFTSVYVDGISQLKASFSISGKELKVFNVSNKSTVTVIIRKYEPTAIELSFNPDVKDDLTIQRNYKQDYEYVSLPVRDREGALSSSIYFFWVKNKTTAAIGKKLSVQSVAQQLREGPPSFLTFQNLSDEAPYYYDAITLSGLSYLVTKDDTFKLRFTRNFTLRDDPQDLDLKNIHTEWALMRPGQKTRIPETLWNKLTDSVVGKDAANNEIPSIRRVLYDERNNTRTRFGFNNEQTLAPLDLLRSSIVYTVLNTKLEANGAPGQPDYISFLDLDNPEEWFSTDERARKTMIDIWNQSSVAQVNEIFFAVLNDILASNYELSDIFKTSRLSAYSIKVVTGSAVAPSFE